MKTIKFVTICLCFLSVLGPTRALTEGTERGNLGMIIGKPSKVKFIRDLAIETMDPERGSYFSGDLYEVEFRDFDVIFGEIENKKKFKVRLTAIREIYFDREIYVLVDLSDKAEPVGLFWNPVRQIICFPPGVFDDLDETYQDLDIKDNLHDFWNYKRNMCKLIW